MINETVPMLPLKQITNSCAATIRAAAAMRTINLPMAEGSKPDVEALLLATDWVRMLDERTKERVVADCHDRIYSPKEVVARQGEPVTSWIGVVDGLLKVSTVTASGRSIMFTAVPSGSWVGEGSVIKREPRRYELLALRMTRVVHVPRATFMWLLETSTEFSRYIIDHLNERTGQFVGMMEVSRITDPAGRVAGALCNLFNPVLNPKASPLLNISQEELGELAGFTRSTINAALMKLRKLDLVHSEYGGILVLDVDSLRAFFHSVGTDEHGSDEK